MCSLQRLGWGGAAGPSKSPFSRRGLQLRCEVNTRRQRSRAMQPVRAGRSERGELAPQRAEHVLAPAPALFGSRRDGDGEAAPSEAASVLVGGSEPARRGSPREDARSASREQPKRVQLCRISQPLGAATCSAVAPRGSASGAAAGAALSDSAGADEPREARRARAAAREEPCSATPKRRASGTLART